MKLLIKSYTQRLLVLALSHTGSAGTSMLPCTFAARRDVRCLQQRSKERDTSKVHRLCFLRPFAPGVRCVASGGQRELTGQEGGDVIAVGIEGELGEGNLEVGELMDGL